MTADPTPQESSPQAGRHTGQQTGPHQRPETPRPGHQGHPDEPAETAFRLTSVFGAIKALTWVREQWIVLVALATAVFWARDALDAFAHLPDTLAGHDRHIAALSQRLAYVEGRLGVRFERLGRQDRPCPASHNGGTGQPCQNAHPRAHQDQAHT
ncbi:MAG: hypothetical protein AAGI34_07375, partial [Pseudomonadota bacterium]